MSIINVDFDVPDDIENRIESGELIRNGGVVRNTDGTIFKHLDEAAPRDNDNDSNDNNMVRAIGVAVGACVFAFFGIKYLIKRHNEKKRQEEAEERFRKEERIQIEEEHLNKEFNQAFSKYLIALKNKTLNDDVINTLKNSLNALQSFYKENQIHSSLYKEDLEEVVTVVNEFTMKIRPENIAKPSEMEQDTNSMDTEELLDLLSADLKEQSEALELKE